MFDLGRIAKLFVPALVVGCGSHPPHTASAVPVAPATSAEAPAPQPATPAAAERPPTPLEPPPDSARFGSADPFLFHTASPDRRWLAICQAREDTDRDGKIAVRLGPSGTLSGDELAAFLIEGDGMGERIDSFAASSPDGRFVAFATGGSLWLRDTHHRLADVDLGALGADTRNDLGPFLPHRALSFSPDSQLMAYHRPNGTHPGIVLRDLNTNAEQVIPLPGGLFWRANFEDSGQYLVLQVVVADTNRNGRLDWPYRAERQPHPHCVPPIPRYPVWTFPGDRPATLLVELHTLKLFDAPGYIAALNQRWLRRTEDGALEFAVGRDAPVGVAAAECGAKVLHVDARRELVLAACTEGKKVASEVFLLGAGVCQPLGIEVSAFELDQNYRGQPRLVPIYPGSDTTLFDLETRALSRLQPGDQILTTSVDHALLIRSRRLVWHALDGSEQILHSQLEPLHPILQQGSTFAVFPTITDATQGTLLGYTSALPLALARDGYLLLPETSGDVARLPTGPLRWQAPSPERSGAR